jgi:F0F1-type ATP synthase assembly protein I
MKFTKSLIQTISLSLQLGFMIALPVVIFTIVGRILDKTLLTTPLFLVLGIILALAVSTILIYQKIKVILKESEKEKND